ncbi:MAG: S8 family peptidase [Muribaculaceae bacterium]
MKINIVAEMKLHRMFMLLVLVASTFAAVMLAQGRMSNSTRAFLNHKDALRQDSTQAVESAPRASRHGLRAAKSERRGMRSNAMVPVKKVNGEETVQVFVNINAGGEAIIDSIEAIGAQVNGEFGNILTVTVPVSGIERLSQLGNVRQVSVARRARLSTDKQRSTSNVDKVLAGSGLSMPYSGKDVVVGIIDDGIDFNHLAFKDANGNTRVSRVYMPNGSGNAPVVNGHTLPGADYTTPEEIARLTTDDDSESHGTHTSCIAAGTKVGNYGGMAPDADIVLCGLGTDLSDANIVNSVNYIFNYAESVGKPAVVNMSFGDHIGPHDGTSDFCKTLDSMCDNGRLMVLAAGNEGDYALHFSSVFEGSATTQSSQKAVLLTDYDWQGGYYDAAIDIYGRDSRSFTFQYVVVDATGKQLCLSPKQTLSANGTVFNMSSHSTFMNYYDGSATAYGVVDANSGKYNIYLEIQAETTSDNDADWYLGLLFWGVSGQQIDGWDIEGYTDFTNLGYDSYINGDSEMSISGMATGENTISVGAFAAKTSYKAVSGETYYYLNFTESQIASFSSYGPDANGVQRPDICADGVTVVSGVNGYDSNTVSSGYKYLAAEVKDDSGKMHYWGDMLGTSQSAPEVAGILALWLQVNPQLDAADVRDVFQQTAIRDDNVNDSKRWGYGKIDALAGIKYVLSSGINRVKTDESNMTLYRNAATGLYEVYAPGDDCVKLSVYAISGRLVYQTSLNVSGGVASVDLAADLEPGIYVAKLNGKNCHNSLKLVVK